MSIKHINIQLTGRVQGVWFRAYARQQAEALGINGFVRNLPDGSVYAECEGDETQLQAMLQWCQQGPPLARVDNITISEGPVNGFHHFEIR